MLIVSTCAYGILPLQAEHLTVLQLEWINLSITFYKLFGGLDKKN